MNKRIVKSPKLFFYDTGLLCHLLGIKTLTALKSNSLYGSIFENWVITEIKKNNFNSGINGGLYYFRDSIGNEVDLVLEKGDFPIGIEIKSSTKFNTEMLRGLKYWQKQHPFQLKK
jgi:predicted AAA+ superfamily ATPase